MSASAARPQLCCGDNDPINHVGDVRVTGARPLASPHYISMVNHIDTLVSNIIQFIYIRVNKCYVVSGDDSFPTGNWSLEHRLG